MANLCNTDLLIQKTDNTTQKRTMEDMSAEIQEFINDEFAYCSESHQEWCDEDFMEISMDTKWNIPTEKIQELCKKFSVQVRAVGRENCGAFVQVVCVNDKGEVVQDEAIGFLF